MREGGNRAGASAGRNRLATVLCLGLLVAGCGGGVAAPTPENELALGRSTYQTRCALCHDSSAEKAPPILGKPLETGRVEAIVRRGEGGHPTFGPAVLADDRLSALIAYLHAGTGTQPSE